MSAAPAELRSRVSTIGGSPAGSPTRGSRGLNWAKAAEIVHLSGQHGTNIDAGSRGCVNRIHQLLAGRKLRDHAIGAVLQCAPRKLGVGVGMVKDNGQPREVLLENQQ